jgi:hypothetical protein
MKKLLITFVILFLIVIGYRGYKTDWSFQPMSFLEQTGSVITGSMSGEITLSKTLS